MTIETLIGYLTFLLQCADADDTEETRYPRPWNALSFQDRRALGEKVRNTVFARVAFWLAEGSHRPASRTDWHLLLLTEEDRQMVLLALAKLSVERPGFDESIHRVACGIDKVKDGRAVMYDELRRTAAPHDPLPAE